MDYVASVALLRHYAHQYYVLDAPVVTDDDYNKLFNQVEAYEETHPDEILLNSPTQLIGSPVVSKLDKITHRSKLYSLDNVFNLADLQNWVQQLGKYPITLVGEAKYDGLAITATYAGDGKLRYAATRGDGEVGENITHNFILADGAAVRVQPVDEVVEIRGEIVMPISTFLIINRKAALLKEREFANPRNAAAGTMRLLDPKAAAGRGLKFIPYETYYRTQDGGDELMLLPGKPLFTIELKSDADVVTLHEMILDQQIELSKLDYATDGVVLKVKGHAQRIALGYTNRVPRWATAYKYPAGEAISELLDVVFQVGRTGAITPVAKIRPVPLAGVVISSVTLYNPEELNRLNLHYGDTVCVRRQGEVIPKLFQMRDDSVDLNTKVLVPMECPSCDGPVTPDGPMLYCCNANCQAQSLNKIIHFVSRDAMNIDGLADKLVAKIMEAGLITTAADLYKLTVDDLMTLDRMGQVLATKLITNIQNSRTVDYAKFLYALGIPEVGVTTAKTIVNHQGSLAWLLTAEISDLQAIPDVGPVVSTSIYNYFRDTESLDLVTRLTDYCTLTNSNVSSSTAKPLLGDSYVITGTLTNTGRDALQADIEALGGVVKSSVSAKTDVVIYGEKAGSKLQAAISLSRPMLDATTMTITEIITHLTALKGNSA